MKNISRFILGLVLISGFSGVLFSKAPPPLTKAKLALNWVPEPEFGGFYAAKLNKIYEKNGLDIELVVGGSGSPTIQLVAAGKVDFAIASGGEVITARARGADVVSVFAVYQKSPLVLMAHKSRGFKKIDDIFSNAGILSIEKGQGFATFLEKKYGFDKIKVVPYTGGVANFVHDKNFTQQGFAFSEPILAKRQGAEPQIFYLEDSGYKIPYMEVLVVSKNFLKKNEEIVKRLVWASRQGWAEYLKSPQPTNKLMATLNKAMDLKTFEEGAAAQAALLENSLTKKYGLGWMTAERWEEQAEQLVDLKIIPKSLKGSEYFQNF